MSLAFAVPHLDVGHDALWDTILDLSLLLDDGTWVLVGGQAVIAHALVHRVSDARLARDPDPIGRLVTIASALPTVQKSFSYLGFAPDAQVSTAHASMLAFLRPPEASAPEAGPQRWRVHVVGQTHLPGGDQAFARRVPYRATKGMRSPFVPVPDLLSTIVYEANRFATDTADPYAHARDVAFLTSLLEDVEHQRDRLTPGDRRALATLDETIGESTHRVWANAAPGRNAYVAWRSLLAV